ncbi:hypothetical protein P872_08685 [Rhodonellum psychrophilum GCM71 = DSM 17998]|uniref:Outer membrane protein beta-barrel domain-containing protein n=2 Tax=Rhodonellum TaxID=336827 RepID=U5BNC6_9BACT|nr:MULTISPECIES: hypothetical protein [Rhodonellum]ERM82045.1 hypothetical protein P872_08685 [Rhodonellum psychrophilum GCM71 = DSM 17998]
MKIKKISRFLAVGFLILGFSTLGYGQNFYKERIPKTDIFSIGIGPSFIYADNGGPYRTFKFEWDPAFSLSYTKKFSNRFAFKTTTGIQWIQSSVSPSIQVQERWIANNGAFRFKGHAFYADVMPIMYLFPFHSHMNRRFVNLYGGLGIGLLHVNRVQAFSMSDDALETRAKTTTGYVPFRAGISFRLGALSDLALEGTMLFSFSDNLDGNANFNRFGDHMAQAQLVYKKFLKPRSKK